MKKNYKIILLTCFLLFSILGFSQSTDQVDVIQDLWGQEKKEMVASYLTLMPEEEPAFWEKYDAYELARKELSRERLNIINEYAEGADDITSEEVTDLINRGIANNMALQKLIKKTFKGMSKIVSPVQAAIFVQIENYLMLATLMAVQESIMFIGEIEDAKLEE